MLNRNQAFLLVGLQAIENRYRRWFITQRCFSYLSANLEGYFADAAYDLPNGNRRRWDYLIERQQNDVLDRVVFAEPHPIKEGNVDEVIEKLSWLKYTIRNADELQRFRNTNNEYYWVYNNSSISSNSRSRRKCYAVGLRITSIPINL